MSVETIHPPQPDPAALRELYRAIADAAMAAVLAGPPLPTQKPRPPSEGPCPVCGQGKQP